MKLQRQEMLIAALFFLIGPLLVRLTSPARATITWETASEVDTAGFHLYRATPPDPSFERITSTPIPAQGDPLTGAEYRYQDKNVRWGARYRYQLEEVTLSGSTQKYPEIVESRAGLGWGWALGSGAGLAALSLLIALVFPVAGESSAASRPERTEEPTP
ncbi:MAG: hypothetical protein ACP5HM_05655 [Anaerolineae bacterium]